MESGGPGVIVLWATAGVASCAITAVPNNISAAKSEYIFLDLISFLNAIFLSFGILLILQI